MNRSRKNTRHLAAGPLGGDRPCVYWDNALNTRYIGTRLTDPAEPDREHVLRLDLVDARLMAERMLNAVEMAEAANRADAHRTAVRAAHQRREALAANGWDV